MKLVNQQLIKDTNMKRLYNAIYANPGTSRANLAKLTHLSKTTVSTLIDEMIDREFVLDSGIGKSDSIGRKPNCLQVCTSSYFVVVLNWVEDNVFAYLIDIAGSIIYEEEYHLSSGETYLSASRTCFYESLLKHCTPKRVLGICVVVSAMIDARHNEIYSTTLSLPAIGRDNPLESLSDTFPEYPTALLEDTACYAYAEKIFAGIKEKDFAFLNFGRGLGATLFIEGQMMGKASGSFTQFGHYSVDVNGPLCACGNRGCLEALISENRLKERLTEFGESPALSRLDHVTFADLGKAVTFRDPAALKLIDKMAWELAQALSNLICIVNPGLIILGGKIPALGEPFLQMLRKYLSEIGFRKMVDTATICYSTLQKDSYLNGAMKYFFDIHFCFTSENPSAFFIG